MAKFVLVKLLADVFQPVKEDVFTVMIDLPHGTIKDNDEWAKRREMAREWHDGLVRLAAKMGFKVRPMVAYPATGAHNIDFPEKGSSNGEEVTMEDSINKSTVIVSMVEFSATAPLIVHAKQHPNLRIASMPCCIREMEKTALSADYTVVAALCQKLKELLLPTCGAEVAFSTGHKCYFDLRGGKVVEDNGLLPPSRVHPKLINLPSGEVFKVPFESTESLTKGDLPVMYGDELVVYKAKADRIVEVVGDGAKAKEMRDYFQLDPARANIAEFGLGCNECAVVRGNGIEDEKAGFHWAYGRSDHLGGKCGVDRFKTPDTVIHQDNIYSHGSPITVDFILLCYPDGTKKDIWDGKWYIV